jgi:cell pole-organizing protein PopZ
MEDILASIRRIIADDQDGARPAESSLGPSRPAGSTQPDPDLLDASDPEPASGRSAEAEHEDFAIDGAGEATGSATAASSALSEVVEPDPSHEAPRPAPRPAGQPAPLLSGLAQATAANAFQRLSTTVLSNSPRTLEDVVTEMLRPALKAWLDENLPPLVERLVQAEIERVARGGR